MTDQILWVIISSIERYAKNSLYKTSSTYNAFTSRIDKLFRKFEPKFSLIIQDIIKDTIPENMQNIANDLISVWFYDTIENTEKKIEEVEALRILKNNYFLANPEFLRMSKDLENNLKSFADSYNLQIKNYHESKNIDFYKLLNEKKHCMISINEWLQEFEKIYFEEITKFKDKFILHSKFQSILPITDWEIEELNNLYNNIPNIIEQWKNKSYYERLAKEIDNLFIDMIDLLKS